MQATDSWGDMSSLNPFNMDYGAMRLEAIIFAEVLGGFRHHSAHNLIAKCLHYLL